MNTEFGEWSFMEQLTVEKIVKTLAHLNIHLTPNSWAIVGGLPFRMALAKYFNELFYYQLKDKTTSLVIDIFAEDPQKRNCQKVVFESIEIIVPIKKK